MADGLSGCSLAADEDIQSYCGRNMHTQHKPFFQAKKQCLFFFGSIIILKSIILLFWMADSFSNALDWYMSHTTAVAVILSFFTST